MVEHRRLDDGSAGLREDSSEDVIPYQEDSVLQEEADQDESAEVPDIVTEESGVAVLLEVDDSLVENETETAEENLDDSTTSEEETPQRRVMTRERIPRTVTNFSKLGGDLVRDLPAT